MGRHRKTLGIWAALMVLAPLTAWAENGDPQLMTDHPFYGGELTCSTFPRLFKTEAAQYKAATGRGVDTDQDKVLAAWYFRNTHYAHCEEGKPDLFGPGKREWNRNYWTGLFAYGFGLCGTTHCQWTAEMHELLGMCRGRVAGVDGHNSFEVYLQDPAYGQGAWVLLDHDQSTVVFNDDGTKMMGVFDFMKDINKWCSQSYKPERQHGWVPGGLHAGDVADYDTFTVAEYNDGYSGPPPQVHLRAGESLRRYLRPGLEDGKTYVYWGLNCNDGGIPGPSRIQTWVNQPETMYGAKQSCTPRNGQARFANAVYTYKPNFQSGSYKEGVVDEDKDHVTFEFYSPYTIACTPGAGGAWGIYEKGGKNGLVLHGSMTCAVSVSVDQGKTWLDAGKAADGLDLTDSVKGHDQYLLKLGAGAEALKASNLTMVTVCECNSTIIPHLKDGANKLTFWSGGTGVVAAGPNLDQAEAHLVDGKFGSSSVTLELTAPRGEKTVAVHGMSWQSSGCPPKDSVKYQIDYSTDGGKTWAPVVKDWSVKLREPEPGDWWSQSLTWGGVQIPETAGPIRVRFTNSGGVNYRKAEAYLVYKVSKPGPVDVTFNYSEGGAAKTATHSFKGEAGKEDTAWSFTCAKGVVTNWVEYACK